MTFFPKPQPTAYKPTATEVSVALAELDREITRSRALSRNDKPHHHDDDRTPNYKRMDDLLEQRYALSPVDREAGSEEFWSVVHTTP